MPVVGRIGKKSDSKWHIFRCYNFFQFTGDFFPIRIWAASNSVKASVWSRCFPQGALREGALDWGSPRLECEEHSTTDRIERTGKGGSRNALLRPFWGKRGWVRVSGGTAPGHGRDSLPLKCHPRHFYPSMRGVSYPPRLRLLIR